MKIKRRASVAWDGGFLTGHGAVSTASTALSAYPYGYASRFDNVPGTNPEELLGAAHAACFTMSLAYALDQQGLIAEHMKTSAEVVIEPVPEGFTITAIHLTTKVTVPGLDTAMFAQIAAGAKAGCPVSKVLNAEITLDAILDA